MAKLLSIDKLEEGMILQEDIVQKTTGVILVAKDTVIKERHIIKLFRHKVRNVNIKEEVNIYNYNEDLMNSYCKVEQKLDDLFNDINSGKEIEVDEIFFEMEGFAQEISKERDILSQMRMLNQKDDYTFNHSLAVSVLSISLGKWNNYSKEQIFDLAITGLFHDIGKLRIPDEIINKAGKLTEEEFEIVKEHSRYGYDMLLETGKFNDDILLGILQHHEKINGQGYPQKLKGEEIHEYAKIVSICDVYHALISKRSYKDKKNPLKVADYIKHESFNSLDPYLCHVFLENISTFYVGNSVLLSNGEIGTIIYIHPQDRTKTIVKVGENFINFLNPQNVEIVEIVV